MKSCDKRRVFCWDVMIGFLLQDIDAPAVTDRWTIITSHTFGLTARLFKHHSSVGHLFKVNSKVILIQTPLQNSKSRSNRFHVAFGQESLLVSRERLLYPYRSRQFISFWNTRIILQLAAINNQEATFNDLFPASINLHWTLHRQDSRSIIFTCAWRSTVYACLKVKSVECLLKTKNRHLYESACYRIPRLSQKSLSWSRKLLWTGNPCVNKQTSLW